MTLGTLVLMIAAIAVVLTLLVGLVYRSQENWLVTFLQNFCGSLFIFSGAVKAIDPLGTAYKMEQYFAEFQYTFEDTWFSFLAPMFPWLSEYSAGFSVAMIILEIVVGLALIIGSWRKLTSWVFLVIVAFFTFLTGFTYLTGYVPDGVNFFQFAQWGEYVETNMKVTDCGCFGDFLKLEPRVSFMKDVFLMVPALIFVFMHRQMHQLFTPTGRAILLAVVGIGTYIFCISNYKWDLPIVDFRPFKEGVNIAEQKQAEMDAAANVEVIAYQLTNKSSGKVVELPYDQFMKEFKNYPGEEWEYEQIQSEPAIERTKISEFEFQSMETGEDMAETVLSIPGYNFFIVSHKMYGEQTGTEVIEVPETTYVRDSVTQEITDTLMTTTTVERGIYSWQQDYLNRWKDALNPVIEAAQADGYPAHAVVAFESPEKVNALREATGSDYTFFVADDILLKTIIRSNPGVVLLKNGEIIKKWHIKKLPSYEEIKANYLQ